MQLYMLDVIPKLNAKRLYSMFGEKYTNKMLIELCQLISSSLGGKQTCTTFDKVIPQGKEFQQFVSKNLIWSVTYMMSLLDIVVACGINVSDKSLKKYNTIYTYVKNLYTAEELLPTIAPFRYSKDYISEYKSGEFLPIDICIEQYMKYAEWKRQKLINRGYIKDVYYAI